MKKIVEKKTGEVYSSKSAMKKHENAESKMEQKKEMTFCKTGKCK